MSKKKNIQSTKQLKKVGQNPVIPSDEVHVQC